MAWCAPTHAETFQVPGGAHGSHVGSERPCDLNGERADTARSPVDEHLLFGADASVIEEALKRRLCGKRHGCGLLEREVVRLGLQRSLRKGDVLGERTRLDPRIHLVTGSEARHTLPNCFDAAGQIATDDRRRLLAVPCAEPREPRLNGYVAQIASIQRRRLDPDQHLQFSGGRRVDLLDGKSRTERSMPVTDHGPHSPLRSGATSQGSSKPSMVDHPPRRL